MGISQTKRTASVVLVPNRHRLTIDVNTPVEAWRMIAIGGASALDVQASDRITPVC